MNKTGSLTKRSHKKNQANSGAEEHNKWNFKM